jgi:hypothetical protein
MSATACSRPARSLVFFVHAALPAGDCLGPLGRYDQLALGHQLGPEVEPVHLLRLSGEHLRVTLLRLPRRALVDDEGRGDHGDDEAGDAADRPNVLGTVVAGNDRNQYDDRGEDVHHLEAGRLHVGPDDVEACACGGEAG